MSTYTVRPGDTLCRIAQRECGGRITWQKIAADNNIINPDLIYVGDVLTLNCDVGGAEPPPDGAMTYIVQPGDSLWLIAQRECRGELTPDQIAADNNIADPDRIQVGQRLVLNCVGQGGGPGTTPATTGEYSGTWVNLSGQLLDGIDVSHWQGDIQWSAVKGHGIKFAIIKATEGHHYTDPHFATNWVKARNLGIVRGAYHYFRAQQNPTRQVDHFLNQMNLEPNDLPPALDIEETFNTGASHQQWIDGMGTWLGTLESRTGRRPIMYSRASFLNTLPIPADFRRYPLWVAHYGVQQPALPNVWDSWVIWQHVSTGHVAGIQGNVDLNRFNGSHSELLDFILQTS
jgi:lysozyme